MTLLFESIPMVVFCVAYRWNGLYTATASFMLASTLQLLLYWLRGKNIPVVQWISFLLLSTMGTATLITQNSLFIKLKPSLLYWGLAFSCFVSPYWNRTNLVQYFLEPLLEMPERLWLILNRWWIGFFVCLGLLNIVLAYTLETSHWMYFKLFGLLSIKLLFLFLQILYFSHFIKTNHERS